MLLGPVDAPRAAKEEQRDIELRIEEIDKILKNAEVVDDDAESGEINVGCTVRIKDLEFDEEMEYKIVGSTEADSLQGKISNESPLGKAMIGKKRGDIIKVDFMGNEVKYQVLDVKRY